MDPNPTTEVQLRRRSTPYEFLVTLARDGRSLRLYNGKSHNKARAAY